MVYGVLLAGIEDLGVAGVRCALEGGKKLHTATACDSSYDADVKR